MWPHIKQPSSFVLSTGCIFDRNAWGGKRVYVTCIVTAPQTVCHTEICMFSDGDAENLYGYSNVLYLSLF